MWLILVVVVNDNDPMHNGLHKETEEKIELFNEHEYVLWGDILICKSITFGDCTIVNSARHPW